jgi:hypothetical protein
LRWYAVMRFFFSLSPQLSARYLSGHIGRPCRVRVRNRPTTLDGRAGLGLGRPRWTAVQG